MNKIIMRTKVMDRLSVKSCLLLACFLAFMSCEARRAGYDILVIGGGTSGTAAAVQAARSGAKVLLVEEHEWLGGMLTSAGVSATDGCYKLKGGFWGEFRDSLEAYYGGPDALKSGWVSNIMFEPSVGARIFKNIAAKEKKLQIRFNTKAIGFERVDTGWKVTLADAEDKLSEVYGKLLIDATELGDVAAAVGIPYTIGMDSSKDTHEDIAPEEANSIIQDLTYVMILQDYEHPVPVPEPEGYNPAEFACCCFNSHCISPKEKNRMWSAEEMLTYGRLPNGKYMINWPIEGNDFYCNAIEMTAVQRDSLFNEAKQRSLRFLYFIQNELGFKNIGFAEEYPTEDGFPFIPYHRESRRIEGKVRFNLNDITSPYGQTKKLYRTAIAVGDYPVDQHHTRYSGWESLPDLHFYPIPSYGLPIGVMMPKGYEDVLVIEKSISVTNIVNGTTRLQPVVMQLGQAAGVLAAMAVKEACGVSEVSVRKVQTELLNNGAYLLPLLDLPADDPCFKPMQRIALTGILKCEGKTEGWENQTWFHTGKHVSEKELLDGFKEFYRGLKQDDGTPLRLDDIAGTENMVDAGYLSLLVAKAEGRDIKEVSAELETVLKTSFGKEYDDSSVLTRLECAVAIDALADPFGKYEVDIYGNLMASSEN